MMKKSQIFLEKSPNKKERKERPVNLFQIYFHVPQQLHGILAPKKNYSKW